MRRRIVVPASITSFTILMLSLAWPPTDPVGAQQQLSSRSATRQQQVKYVGLTKCAACHFEKYKDWKSSEHAQAFDILPAKYRNDATCLKCHTTGLLAGERLTASHAATYAQGVSCEACHGPGSEHADYALRFVNEQITEDGLRQLREKIQRIDMLQCIHCHISKAHQKHPAFERDASAPRPSQRRSAGFFDRVHDGQARNSDISAMERRVALPEY